LQKLFEKKQDFEVKDPKKTLNGFFEREGLFKVKHKNEISSVLKINF